ncbi:MAG: glycosyltransferase family 2 protein [Armatimonadetes bacterium]|nr:glycosyltransferase family 2 protein [Armatimonadota bacterium]
MIVAAYNQELTIGSVLDEIPRQHVLQLLVADSRSTDATAAVAASRGATVVPVPVPGYGQAWISALEHLRPEVEVVVFLSADGADKPGELACLLVPIRLDRADLVIGSRLMGKREPGSLPAREILGSWLAAFLIRLLYGVEVTDLGPFRAIRRSVLEDLALEPAAIAWTAEMIVKAARLGYRITEVPAGTRRLVRRTRPSKSSWKVLRAVLRTIFRYARGPVR